MAKKEQPPKTVDVKNNETFLEQVKYIEQKLGRKLQGNEREDLKREVRQQIFLHHFFKTCNITTACICTGISRSQFSTWMKLYPEFKESVEEVREAELDLAEDMLMRNVKAGKETSIIFFLCNRGRHRNWQSVNKIKLQGDKNRTYTIFYGKIDSKGNVKRVNSTQKNALLISDDEVVIGVKPKNGNDGGKTG